MNKPTPNQYVQYGCGLCAPATWRNFDASPTLRLQRIPVLGRYFTGGKYPLFPKNVEHGDIAQGLPLQPKSCRAIYCSHILEHLSLQDFRIALANTYRYLDQGGIFRFVLPDLEQLAKDYLTSSEPDAANQFMTDSCLGKPNRPTGFQGLLREWLGNSAHLWMWDYKSIVPELQAAGFTQIRRATFGDYTDPRFEDVEDLGRWHDCLGIECIRES